MNFSSIIKKLKHQISKNLEENSKISNAPYALGACCMDKRYNVISFGYNSYTKTHPTQKEIATRYKASYYHKEFLHAEISSLIKCKGKVPYSILVIRQLKNGTMGNAKPCPICRLAIKEAGVKEIWFSNQDGNIEFIEIKEGELL